MTKTVLSFAVLFVVAVLAGFAPIAAAQDAAKALDPRTVKVLVDNAHVRVLEFTLPPGAKDPVHTHAAGVYVVTSPGVLKVLPVGGAPETWNAKLHETAWMEAEGPHASENVGKTPLSFVLVEIKSAAK